MDHLGEAMEMITTYQIQIKRWGRWIDYSYPFIDENKIEQVENNAIDTYEGLNCPIQLVKTTRECFLRRVGEKD